VASDPIPFSPIFRIDVSAEPERSTPANSDNAGQATLTLLHQLVASQQRQNQLLEQLVNATVSAQKQRTTELQQWKDANPQLSQACRRAAEILSRVQSEFLEKMTEEIEDQQEDLVDGEYVLNEFVDRFGPRLAHLNGVLQILAQLSTNQAGQA
jgi:predicted DsbA family dithiol-disulfide isomerase